jgi:hypothetical protein
VEVTDETLSILTPIQWYRGNEPHLNLNVGQIIYFGPPTVSVPNEITSIAHSRRSAAMRRGYVYTTHVTVKALVGPLSGRKKGS